MSDRILFDAGVLIGALLSDDPRHSEAAPRVEAARRGELQGCVTPGILSEVYAALTWVGVQPPHSSAEASEAVFRLVEPPSRIDVLPEGLESSQRMLRIAADHALTARRIHDARHAAVALISGVGRVFTYDPADWSVFASDGIQIVGPPSQTTSPHA